MIDNRTLETRNIFVIIVAFSAVAYNGVLAVINAHLMPLGFAHVALTEISILCLASLLILRKGLGPVDKVWQPYFGGGQSDEC